MNKKLLKKILLLGFLLVGLFLIKTDFVLAAATYDIEGYAWSSNIGWISFSCTDAGTCGTSNYGVELNWGSGAITGYAWSSNIGWIDFDPVGPYPEAPNYSVQMNMSNNEVSGWARALSYGGGWDGWIKMRDGSYGVYMDARGYFHDWAWGSDIIGWTSFNCLNDSSCGVSNYKVKLVSTPPIISNIAVSPETAISSEYCTDPAVYTFTWDFTDVDSAVFGDVQESFQIQVDNNSDFSSPEIDTTLVTGVESHLIRVADVGYDGVAHYFRIRLYDDRGGISTWGTSPLGKFTTPVHRYPDALYSYLPSVPSKNESIQFYDESVAYGTGIPISEWGWIFRNVDDSILETSGLQTPSAFAFPDMGDMEVELKVVDSDDYTCTIIDSGFFVNLELPEWREVVPN